MTQPSATVDRIERLDRLLPQTQCGQCGYDGCRPYAEAMAHGDAGPDHCPPGGDAGAQALAALLGMPGQPYDRSRGLHKPPQVAVVVEADCIGCTKCIQACPVDAIIGGAKLMHVVIEPLCTGCELCVPACPVDCIELRPTPPLDGRRVLDQGSTAHARRRSTHTGETVRSGSLVNRAHARNQQSFACSPVIQQTET